MSWDPMLLEYLLGSTGQQSPGFVPDAPGFQAPTPPSWSVEQAQPSRAPAPAPQPQAQAPSGPPINLMDYFRAMRPELYSQESMDRAIADDKETNQNREMARSFSRAVGHFTNDAPDYTGLGPTDRAVKELGVRQDQAMKSAEVGVKVGQFMQAADAQDPMSGRSRLAVYLAQKGPLGKQFVETFGQNPKISETQVAQWMNSQKEGTAVGKTYAETRQAESSAKASEGKESREAQLFPVELQKGHLGNQKTSAEIKNTAADTALKGAQTKKTEAETVGIPKQRANEIEKELHSAFTSEQVYKNTQQVLEAARKVQTATATAAGDISLVYGYMKLLDPGSAVREGEYATAANAGGAFDKVGAIYNRVLKGEKLPENVRAGFKAEAKTLVDAQLSRYNPLANEYRELATRKGANPANVVLDLGYDAGAGGSAAPGSNLQTLQPK